MLPTLKVTIKDPFVFKESLHYFKKIPIDVASQEYSYNHLIVHSDRFWWESLIFKTAVQTDYPSTS